LSPSLSPSLVPASPPSPPAPYIAPEEPTSTVKTVPESQPVPVLTAQLLILPVAEPIVLLIWILVLVPLEFAGRVANPPITV